MKFYDRLRLQYSPKMSPIEFDVAINDVENELFNSDPSLLRLGEDEQNLYVENAYKNSGYVKRKP